MDTKFVNAVIIQHVWHNILDSADGDEKGNKRNKIVLEKVFNFAEDVVPRMSENQFKVHFRMYAATFEDFLGKMHHFNQTVLKKGQPEIPLEKRCLITIWCLANPECFRSVADRFGVAISTCWRVLYATCKDILKVNTKHRIISWPTAERAMVINDSFSRKEGITGIIGFIDGSHIPIKAPKLASNSYVNRKGFHSLLLQAVCDHKLLFTDCYAGEAGSIHDALLYQRSDLSKAIGRGTIQFPNNSYMVGDAAYPLKEYLITPFKDNGYLTDRQKNFNYILSKVRQNIERAFALLKGRFRRLKFLETVRQDLAVLLIISACVMHNICLLQGDCINIDNLEELPNENVCIRDVPSNEEAPARTAVNKRNNIVNSLPMLLNIH